MASRMERSVAARLRSLPNPTQRLPLTAVAEPVGDVPLPLAAAQGGLETSALSRFQHEV
jgi:hypothetical protein